MNDGYMMDAKRYTKTALDVSGKLHIKLHQPPGTNDTWVGYIEDPRRNQTDDIGALYYVVAVIFIYGLSIVMMIASHIRKNKQDNQLRAYLKEMATLRKTDRREKVFAKISDLAHLKNVHDTTDTQRKQQEKAKETTDTDGETSHPLVVKKENNEETTDSVFLPADYCIPPTLAKADDKDAEDAEDEAETPGPLRSESMSSHRECASSRNPIASVSDTPKFPSNRKSPGVHDYRRWKKAAELRPNNTFECRLGRRPERPTHITGESYRSVLSQDSEVRSPTVNEFRLSTLYGRPKPWTSMEQKQHRWTFAKPASQLKTHQLSSQRKDFKQTESKTDESETCLQNKPIIFPADFKVVNEDAVL